MPKREDDLGSGNKREWGGKWIEDNVVCSNE